MTWWTLCVIAASAVIAFGLIGTLLIGALALFAFYGKHGPE